MFFVLYFTLSTPTFFPRFGIAGWKPSHSSWCGTQLAVTSEARHLVDGVLERKPKDMKVSYSPIRLFRGFWYITSACYLRICLQKEIVYLYVLWRADGYNTRYRIEHHNMKNETIEVWLVQGLALLSRRISGRSRRLRKNLGWCWWEEWVRCAVVDGRRIFGRGRRSMRC